MRWKPHARFGRRPGETEQPKRRHRAPGRPHLAGDALDQCRRRVQQQLHGHRGRTGDPLYRRGAPCTPAPTCSPRNSSTGSTELFAADAHVEVEATWGIYQRMIAAYREPDRTRGRELMGS